jgi:drug/metabolite transporter (DMT)-like permease
MALYKKLKPVFFWLLLVSSDTTAQLLVKVGAVKTSGSGWMPHYLIPVGYSFYILSFIAWMQILRNTRLSIALSAASILYITVAIGSHIFLGEPLTLRITIGTLLISAGVFVLGWSESRKK